MLDAFTDRPVLAIALIAFLVWVGIRAINPRTIRYRQLYILPSVFLVISANQMFNSYTFNILGLTVWIVATLAAALISWRNAERTDIEIDRAKATIALPGTWVTLSLMLVFIAARLYFGRQLYADNELRNDYVFSAQILAMSGLVTGYYLGRSGSFLLRYFRTTT